MEGNDFFTKVMAKDKIHGLCISSWETLFSNDEFIEHIDRFVYK